MPLAFPRRPPDVKWTIIPASNRRSGFRIWSGSLTVPRSAGQDFLDMGKIASFNLPGRLWVCGVTVICCVTVKGCGGVVDLPPEHPVFCWNNR